MTILVALLASGILLLSAHAARTAACAVGPSCAAVFHRPEARLFGLPNAWLGIAYALLVLALGPLPTARPLLLVVAGLALGASGYLAAVLVRHRLRCPVCVASHLANAALFLALLS